MPDIDKLKATLNQMVNDQFASREFKDFLSIPLTQERPRLLWRSNDSCGSTKATS